jgi:methionyl-tRNA formyltransferase
VSTGDGMLRIDLLQMAGKKRMEAKAFLNGVRDLASME